ncbi:MAG: T9SS type A sorting domain-containing protein [Bacteroidales bacterium]|jgi:hypothetical protein|nr:T9SS type A sorting domain-containing protein [Bacteroidales bacterium]
MKKLLPTLLVSLIVSLSHAQVSVWTGNYEPWENGSGTESDPYLIESAENLAYLAYIVNNGIGALGPAVGYNKYYRMTIDVDLVGSQTFQWPSMGFYIPNGNYYFFAGHFDGDGHTVSNMYLESQTLTRAGLFGYAQYGSVRNIGIIGESTVILSGSGSKYLGGIVGYSSDVIIENCYNTANINSYCNSSGSYLCSGGIVGYGSNTTINNCYNTGTISSNTSCSPTGFPSFSYSGGMIGHCIVTENITITNCYNTGEILSSCTSTLANAYSGGIIGYVNVAASMDVTECYNTGNVVAYSSCPSSDDDYSPSSYAGGIISSNSGSNILMNKCYNKGEISATNSANTSKIFSSAGGIIGESKKTTVSNCYNTGEIFSSTFSNAYSGGVVGTSYENILIKNSYNVGTLTGKTRGGILGYKYGSHEVDNSYYLNTCDGSGTFGGMDKISEDMQTQEFVNILNADPLTYKTDIEPFVNEGYPIFSMSVMTTLPATNISYSNATLNGFVNIQNTTLIAQGFEYKKSSEQDFTKINLSPSINELEYDLINLDANTQYTYRVFVEIAEDEYYFGNEEIFITTHIGISVNNTEEIIIYPNPTSGKFIIQFEKAKYQSVNILIFNTAGNIISKINPAEEKTNIDITSLPKGVYYVQIVCDGKIVINKKVLKK